MLLASLHGMLSVISEAERCSCLRIDYTDFAGQQSAAFVESCIRVFYAVCRITVQWYSNCFQEVFRASLPAARSFPSPSRDLLKAREQCPVQQGKKTVHVYKLASLHLLG